MQHFAFICCYCSFCVYILIMPTSHPGKLIYRFLMLSWEAGGLMKGIFVGSPRNHWTDYRALYHLESDENFLFKQHAWDGYVCLLGGVKSGTMHNNQATWQSQLLTKKITYQSWAVHNMLLWCTSCLEYTQFVKGTFIGIKVDFLLKLLFAESVYVVFTGISVLLITVMCLIAWMH